MWPRESVEDGELAAWIQLVDGSTAFFSGHAPAWIIALEIPAIGCGAVDVALRVEHQATLWLYSVLTPENMKQPEFAGGSDFKQRTTAQAFVAQTAIGLPPVG